MASAPRLHPSPAAMFYQACAEAHRMGTPPESIEDVALVAVAARLGVSFETARAKLFARVL